MTSICPECKANLPDAGSCTDAFHQALAWDFEDFSVAGSVHHLTVLCYHLQHPSLYSLRGLQYAMGLLVEFVDKGKTPVEIRRDDAEFVQNDHRKWGVKGSPESQGAYQVPPVWSVTVQDVVMGGLQNYPKKVRAWAESIVEELRRTGNI